MDEVTVLQIAAFMLFSCGFMLLSEAIKKRRGRAWFLLAGIVCVACSIGIFYSVVRLHPELFP